MEPAVVIADLKAQLAAKDAVNAQLVSQLTAARLEIATLREQVALLSEQVAVLLTRQKQNSSNSHKPPSSDGPGARAGTGAKPQGGNKRKRGGQAGRPGARRSLVPPERVDKFVDLYPQSCEGCWTSLRNAPSEIIGRYQTAEIPEIKAHITEYRRHSVKCSCGQTTLASVNATVTHSAFGPRLAAITALLTGVYHVSRRRTRELLRDLLGVDISLGAVSTVEKRMSKAMAPVAAEAMAEINAALVKHADATTWLERGERRSLWTFASAATTAFVVHADGATATIRPSFGDCRGILVSDRATVFNFWPMQRRQICWAHLMRKFEAFSELTNKVGAAVGEELRECTALVFSYWKNFKRGVVDHARFLTLLAPVQEQLEACVERGAKAEIKDLSGSCTDILAHREALWRFSNTPGVEPTNNHAERELRGFVMWRRRSFGAQSVAGSTFAARLMTVAHTARKQGVNVLTFLLKCLEAQSNGATTPSLYPG